MKILSIERTTFDKIKLPETVYKYRQADNSIHLTILTEQEVYFAPPSSFFDKFDCKIPFRYDLLTDKEIYNYYFDALKKAKPNLGYFFLHQQATRWSNMGLLRDKQRLEELELKAQEDFSKVYGVLSLTAEPVNIEMWNKYSDNFNGFCVGFNPRIMFNFFGAGGKVDYVDTLPIIMPTDTLETKMITLTYAKLKEWEFEKEYRTSKMWPHPANDNDRKFKIPNSAYTELIIGHNVKPAIRKQMINQARKINSSIKFLTTYLEDKCVQLKPSS